MQLTDKKYQNIDMTEDVYADVKPSYSTANTQNDTEFSIEAIEEKLGLYKSQLEAEQSAATPDTMPSNQTLTMSYQREYAPDTQSASKVNTKFKIAVAGYAVIILALILAVTLCGVAVTGAFGGALTMDGEYAIVSSQIAELDTQLGTEDYAALVERAAELGYIDASQSNTLTYTKLDTRPAQNFEVQTNWFDNLCDWLCNVFGG